MASSSALVGLSAAQSQQGVAYGVAQSANALGIGIGPLLGGLLYDQVGQEWPFYLNGIILILSAFWVLALLRSDNRAKL